MSTQHNDTIFAELINGNIVIMLWIQSPLKLKNIGTSRQYTFLLFWWYSAIEFSAFPAFKYWAISKTYIAAIFRSSYEISFKLKYWHSIVFVASAWRCVQVATCRYPWYCEHAFTCRYYHIILCGVEWNKHH